jgi:hypothetical protein
VDEDTGVRQAVRSEPKRYAVRELLDAYLTPGRRMERLQALCKRFTSESLDATVADLREVLVDQISMEDYRRLHILISHLSVSCGASISLIIELRAEVNTCLKRRGEPTAPAARTP